MSERRTLFVQRPKICVAFSASIGRLPLELPYRLESNVELYTFSHVLYRIPYLVSKMYRQAETQE